MQTCFGTSEEKEKKKKERKMSFFSRERKTSIKEKIRRGSAALAISEADYNKENARIEEDTRGPHPLA